MMTPVEGFTTVSAPAEAIWERFLDVPNWPSWNRSIARARVGCGQLHEGATLIWWFNPIRGWMPYRMPARATIVEFIPVERVTWEVTALPGFHARHSYLFERDPGGDQSRFGSWEQAEGPAYRLLSRFWDAHFRFVRDQSLLGARRLADQLHD